MTECIKHQIGVDVEKYRTDFAKQWERKGEIIIERKEMPRTDFRKLELLASGKQSRIGMLPIGVCGTMIFWKGGEK